MEADAPKHAPEAWLKANARFTQAMNENETGDARNAQKRAAEAEVLLREVELTAIKNGMLSETRALIAQADEAKVERWAPRSLRRRSVIWRMPSRRSSATATSLTLPAAARRGSLRGESCALSRESSSSRRCSRKRTNRRGSRRWCFQWKSRCERLAADMELGVQFDRGFQPPLKELGERSLQQRQEIRRLEQEIDDRGQQHRGAGCTDRASASHSLAACPRSAWRCSGVWMRRRRCGRTSPGSWSRSRRMKRASIARAKMSSCRCSASSSQPGRAPSARTAKRSCERYAVAELFPGAAIVGRRPHGRERQRLRESDSVAGSRRCGQAVSRDQLSRRTRKRSARSVTAKHVRSQRMKPRRPSPQPPHRPDHSP